MLFLVDGLFQCLPEVCGADYLQNLVFQFGVFDFFQLCIVLEGSAPCLGLLEFICIQLQEPHPAAYGTLRESTVFGDTLHCLAHIQHHLETLGLLIHS